MMMEEIRWHTGIEESCRYVLSVAAACPLLVVSARHAEKACFGGERKKEKTDL